MVNELERVDRPVDPKDIDIVILSGLTLQYDAEVRMLESSSDWPTRELIERAVINQYKRLESEKSAAGSRAMLSARGHRRNAPPTGCPLRSRTGYSALKCRELQITRREKKSNGYQRDGEHGGNGGGDSNGGGSENGGGGGNGRGGESGGVGGNRGGAGSKNHSRGGGKQKKCSTDSESGDKTAPPNATSVQNSTEPRNAQTALPLQRRRPLPTPNLAYFWVVSAPTLGPGCSSSQALTRLWPHATPRARGMKMSTGWQTAALPKI